MWIRPFTFLQKPADDKSVKGKKGAAKAKKEEKEVVPAENGETNAEEVRERHATPP